MYIKIFPFKQLQAIKQMFYKENIYDGFRVSSVHGLDKVGLKELNDPLVFVTYGQSNSTNFGQIGYQHKGPLYMFMNDEIFLFKEPTLGGTGKNSSVWGRVGDLLSVEYSNRSIVFVNAGWEGATIQQLTYDHQYDFFEKQLRSAIKIFGKIDGVLFHQGESDHIKFGRPNDYEETFLVLFKKINLISPIPIYLSQTSVCNSPSDKNLISIQDKLIVKYLGILRGPNTDTLIDAKYRLPDNCHFSSEGLDAMATLWATSIIKGSEE